MVEAQAAEDWSSPLALLLGRIPNDLLGHFVLNPRFQMAGETDAGTIDFAEHILVGAISASSLSENQRAPRASCTLEL